VFANKLLTLKRVITLECLKLKCGECPRHDGAAAVGAKRYSTGLAATRFDLAEIADRHRPQPLRLLRVAGLLEERNIATGPSQNRSTMLHLHAAEHSHCRQRADASVGTRLRAKFTCMTYAIN